MQPQTSPEEKRDYSEPGVDAHDAVGEEAPDRVSGVPAEALERMYDAPSANDPSIPDNQDFNRQGIAQDSASRDAA